MTDGRPVVLVVDDDPLTAALVEVALESPEREVVSVDGIAAAEAVLAQRRVALLVLDILLPDGDGRQLLGRVRAAPDTMDIPVFILTSKLGDLIKAECYQLGADGFFEKPLTAEVLAAAVASRLGRHRRATEVDAAIADVATRAPAPVHTVLVVEDDPLTAELTKHRLGREGYDVAVVDDGAKALETARSASWDAVVLDMKLPGMDGFELLERLRELPGWRNVPILVLTSLGRDHHLERAFALGANDYIVKPFSPTELIARVRRLLVQAR